MAWLHTAPSDKDKHTQPRINTLSTESPFRALPEIEYGEDLAMHLQRMGYVRPSGFGVVALTWTDVRDYSLQYGVHLSGWESEKIIEMSRSYAASAQASKEPSHPAPFAQISDVDRWQQELDRKINAALGIRAKKGDKNGK